VILACVGAMAWRTFRPAGERDAPNRGRE
jgi:hypothetical protein